MTLSGKRKAAVLKAVRQCVAGLERSIRYCRDSYPSPATSRHVARMETEVALLRDVLAEYGPKKRKAAGESPCP